MILTVEELMGDASQKEAATAALNARYIENRKIAAVEYAALLKDMVMPVWNQGDIQKTDQDIDTLYSKLREYNLASSKGDEWGVANALESMNKLTAGMDEGKVAEYLGLLTQIQSLMDSGMSAEEVTALFPEIDVSGQMEQVAALTQFVTDNKTALSGLATMFTGALPEEVLKIATDLDMTGAQTRWSEFAANPGAITTQAVVDGYTESETAVRLQPQVTAFVEKYTEVPAGASKASLTPTGLVAYVSSYAESVLGTDITGLTPTNITAMVAAYKELAAGADVTALTPSEITAYIAKYLEKEKVDTAGLSPDGLTAFVLAYEEAMGGASTAALTPGGVAAMVTSYLSAEGIDASALTPPQLAAIVTAYAEATNVDVSQLGVEVNALIASYKDKEGVVKPSYIGMQVAITGYDLAAYNAFVAANPVKLTGVVRLSEKYENPDDVLNDSNATFWENGKEIPVNLVPASKINADTLMAYEADGTLHVLITPQISGTPEAIEAAAADLTKPGTGVGARTGRTFTAIDPVYLSVLDRVRMLTKQLEDYSNAKGGILGFDFWGAGEALGVGATATIKGALNQTMDADTVAGLQTYVAEVVAAIKAGEPVDQADMDNLQAILDFVSGLEVAGVGENIVAGISGAMAQAGWATDAETTAGNLEAAINLAMGIQSPSTRMIPVGQNAAAGIAQGFTSYDMTGSVSSLADTLSRLAIQYIGPRLLYTQGLQAMAGLSAGIRAGQAGVVAAMVQAAQAAINAAKEVLKITSPSRVFRDEVGRMTMKGLGQGMLLESREQAKVVANAARYLTESARESSVAYATNDNRRTYNQSSKVNLTGNTFYVRDDKDIQSLAIEIAALTRRQHQSRGLRMA